MGIKGKSSLKFLNGKSGLHSAAAWGLGRVLLEGRLAFCLCRSHPRILALGGSHAALASRAGTSPFLLPFLGVRQG